jgi:hypothetical protein
LLAKLAPLNLNGFEISGISANVFGNFFKVKLKFAFNAAFSHTQKQLAKVKRVYLVTCASV